MSSNAKFSGRPSFSNSMSIGASQQLVITPKLRQAINMLQMTNIDLSEFLDKQMDENPLLEKVEPPEQKDFDAGIQAIGAGGGFGKDYSDRQFDENLEAKISLREHLTSQLSLITGEKMDKIIGELLIDQIDERGYITTQPADLAQQIGCDEIQIEKCLKIIRTMDPSGVGANSLSQCLEIQLLEKGKMSDAMRGVLNNLDILGKSDFEGLKKLCGISIDEIKEMLALIKTCNPKPISNFNYTPPQSAIPDVLMRSLPASSGGGWAIELNAATLPRVLIDRTYYAHVSSAAGKNKKAGAYIRQHLENANWIIKALDQRANTIIKVASAIVQRQNAFFIYGAEYLRPMTLKNIADDIEMHESTVSRVCADKYIGTPRGLFALKYFFSSAISGSNGNVAHSGASVRARIKELITSEDEKSPLSDDKIVKALKNHGVDIARRTVTKYRVALKIPSSTDRRRASKAKAA